MATGYIQKLAGFRKFSMADRPNGGIQSVADTPAVGKLLLERTQSVARVE